MLNTDPAHYDKVGYCFFPEILKQAETTALQHLLNEALSDSADDLDHPGYVGEPHSHNLRWLEICRHPRILDAVEAILGPNLILVYSSVFIKRPHDPTQVAWHQDNSYWPSVHGTDVATLWLAVDDADAENAAMQIIPGSQSGHTEMEMIPSGDHQALNSKVAVTPEQEASAITLAMRAGSLSIHDSYILHSSAANQSERRRAGYTIRYCSTDTAWVDTDEHPIPVFLVRGEAGSRGADYVDLRLEVKPTPTIFSQRPSAP